MPTPRPSPSSPLLARPRRRRVAAAALGVLALAGLGACERDPQPAAATTAAPVPRTHPVDFEPEPEYEVRELGRDEVEPLEFLYFPAPVGDGYTRVKARYGPPLLSGKWLRFTNGDARFLADRHVMVAEYQNRPTNVWTDPVVQNVILDVESGEVVATFDERLDVHWAHGFALVTEANRVTPMLFTPQTGQLVPALPAGDNPYILGHNFWLRISPIAPRVWVMAEDDQGQAHVYEWEDLSAPPPLPDNPVAFLPRVNDWYPRASRFLVSVDHEEVTSPGGRCQRAILEPPRGFRCLDDTLLHGSEPVGDGWRYDRDEGTVFKDPTQRLSLNRLCPPGDLDMHVFYDTMLRLTCVENPYQTWAVWSAPARVQALDAAWARTVNKGEDAIVPHIAAGVFEALADRPPNIETCFHPVTLERELVGRDYECDEIHAVRGNGLIYGISCTKPKGQYIDVVDIMKRKRARTKAYDMAIGSTGSIVGLTRHRGKDHVVSIELTHR